MMTRSAIDSSDALCGIGVINLDAQSIGPCYQIDSPRYRIYWTLSSILHGFTNILTKWKQKKTIKTEDIDLKKKGGQWYLSRMNNIISIIKPSFCIDNQLHMVDSRRKATGGIGQEMECRCDLLIETTRSKHLGWLIVSRQRHRQHWTMIGMFETLSTKQIRHHHRACTTQFISSSSMHTTICHQSIDHWPTICTIFAWFSAAPIVPPVVYHHWNKMPQNLPMHP